MDVGEVWVRNRYGKLVPMLVSEDGTRSKQEGRDFASVVARLPVERLAFWNRKLASRPLYHEKNILRAELEKRRVSTSPRDCDGQQLMPWGT